MCQQLYLAHPLSDHIMISHYDLDPSLDLIHHQMLRCIFSLDQAKHQKPITCIFSFDLTLHKIFITSAHIPLIFSSLYSFRPFSIPWTKTTQDQYLGPNTQGQYLGPNALDQLPWTKIPWIKYLGPKTWFSNMYAFFLL